MNRKARLGHSFVASGLAAVLIASGCLVAQAQNSGTVIGTLTDPSGAVEPGAEITLQNVESGITNKTQTNGLGQFRFLTVPVGQYELSAEKTGFAKTVHSAFAVHAAEPERVDLVLKVGSVSEKVTVIGEAPPVINTVTANEGNTITGQQVNTLPLTNRVFTQLMGLEPGVSAPVDVSPGFGSNSSVDFSVNGVRDDENNLLIDGVRNVDTFGGNAFVTPNLFAVSEVRIENNDYTATAGRSAGAQVNLISRSGTNQFHGNVFEFFRNNVFNAMNRFSTINPENRYNDFGYDIGGPIRKDRLFFFWSEEWRRIIQSSGPVITYAPTAAERDGDFSQSLAANFANQQATLIDPSTGSQFPGNVIPANRLDHNAQLLLQTYFPLPTPGYNLSGLNFISEAPDYTRWREESIRIDAKLNEKLNIYGRYTQDSVLLDNPYGLFHENVFPYVGGSTQNFPMYNWSVHLLYAARSNFFTEFSAGMYFANDKALTNGPLSCKCRAQGLDLQQVFPLDELNRIPTMFFDTGNYGGIVEQWYFHNDAFSIPFQSTTTWVRGRHTVRFGAVFTPEGKSELANPSDNNTNGTFSSSGSFSNNSLADFLLGMPANYTETALDPFGKYRWYNLEPFVEDQIKLHNVTLTAALRYEYFQPEYEKHNMFGAFDPALYNRTTAPKLDPSGSDTIVPNSGDLSDGIIVGGHNTYPGANSSPYGRALFPAHYRAFAPRFGVSWDPFSDGKTAIRAGYGIFYDRWGSYSQFGAFSPPFNSSVNITNTNGATTFLDNPGGTPGSIFPATLNAPLAPWKYPSVQKWSLSVQHEVANDTSLSLAYVGTKGSHLLGYYDANQGPPNVQAATTITSSPTIAPDYFRPYQGFSTITAYSTIFDSNYNALQASLIHRLKAGLEFQASYTYSKTLTDNPGPNATVVPFPQDTYNLRSEYGPADFDRTHILTFNYSWELPVFRRSTGITKAFLGGWQLSGITVFQSGAPLTVALSTDNAGVGNYNGNERVNQVGNPFQPGNIAANPGCAGPTQLHTLQDWFNPCAFVIPAAGTFGDEKNGALRGPRFQNWDMGLAKNFPVRESVSLQLQLEAFNVFNHPSWGAPNLFIDTGTFSTITSATSPRLVQISLVLKF